MILTVKQENGLRIAVERYKMNEKYINQSADRKASIHIGKTAEV